MKIGIIGTGPVGGSLAKNLVALGHQVKVTNTRPPAELARKAQELGASPATLQEVVQDVDLFFIAVPFKVLDEFPKDLFRSLPPEVIVVDTGNYYPFRDEKIEAGTPPPESLQQPAGRDDCQRWHRARHARPHRPFHCGRRRARQATPIRPLQRSRLRRGGRG
jgi:ketopantoate reductase